MGIAWALGAAIVSGFSVWLNGQVVTRVELFGDPGTYTTAKNLVAGLVLLGAGLLATAARSSARLVRPRNPSQWWALGAVAVFGGAIPFLLFFEGLAASGSPADAQIAHKAGLLLFVSVLAPPLLKERPGALQLAGVVAIVVGYGFLATDLGGLTLGRGLLLVLAAALLWAVETVVDRWLLSGPDALTPLTVAVARLGVGTIVLLGVGLVTGDTGRLVDLSGAAWGWAALTGAVLAVYAISWLSALALAPAMDVTAVLALASPLTALVVAFDQGVPLPEVPDLPALALVTLGALVAAVAAATNRSPEPVPVVARIPDRSVDGKGT